MGIRHHKAVGHLRSSEVETPSGKGSSDENFPVGSFLLPAHLRPHVAIFYRFARAADDIADNPSLTPQDKTARLNYFEAVLTGECTDSALATVNHMRRSLAQTGISDKHCRDLLTAFRQDAVKLRYASWDELRAYCQLSASPVGRYLFDLHGEGKELWEQSDALCDALQVINHLQDCAADFRALNRIYLPQDWMMQAGAKVEDLDRPSSSLALREVLDRCLRECEQLLDRAKEFPPRLNSRRLGIESAVIVALAQQLVRELRQRDPLAERVVLGRVPMAWIALCAAGNFYFARRPRAALTNSM
jgi:squalene synthase HpnC